MSGEEVRLTVAGAEKRDAGRGVARLPDRARQQLGVLSGDTVVIEGGQRTVAKVWPAGPGVDANVIQIDADTRANAGVQIGDAVRVREGTVDNAEAVSVHVPAPISGADRDRLRSLLTRELEDRPVSEGQRIHVERLGIGPFEIGETDPDGTVYVTEDTHIELPEVGDKERGQGADQRVTYEDIGGLDEELDRVREMIELPLDEPELFHQVGVEPPKGVLLHGPPGTGKTLIARAVANEVSAEFYHISGPEIMSKYKGESEEQLRDRFETAQANAPSIIFFDEIDSVAAARDEEADMENRIVAQLLSLMDGLDQRGDVIVIGATNRVDVIDPALRRAGRFDREIEIGVPDEAGRREILEVHTRRMPIGDDVDLDRLAARTHGFVGADLHALTVEAGMEALRRYTRADDAGPLVGLTVTRDDFQRAMAAVEPSAMREFVAESPSTGFDQVGGLDAAKRTLKEAVEWPLTHRALFEETETDPPTGILLYGPPGTGKTLLARAVANESDVNFIHVAGPELLDQYVGESERAVRKVFERARQSAPTLVFFDEIDAIAGRRGADRNDVSERVVSQLLAELDGLAANPNVMVLAATNRREALDPALLRPGRFEEHVLVPSPDAAGRREILEIHFAGKPLSPDVDLEEIAAELSDVTGAELAAIARDASMRAIRAIASEIDSADVEAHAKDVTITTEHIEAAVASVTETAQQVDQGSPTVRPD